MMFYFCGVLFLKQFIMVLLQAYTMKDGLVLTKSDGLLSSSFYRFDSIDEALDFVSSIVNANPGRVMSVHLHDNYSSYIKVDLNEFGLVFIYNVIDTDKL